MISPANKNPRIMPAIVPAHPLDSREMSFLVPPETSVMLPPERADGVLVRVVLPVRIGCGHVADAEPQACAGGVGVGAHGQLGRAADAQEVGGQRVESAVDRGV